MPRPPRVSILLLGYNRYEETAGKALASLHDDPDSSNWEFVVVDNGSDEAGRAAFASAKVRYPRIQLHHLEKNAGYPGGMNACLARATGDNRLCVLEPRCMCKPDLNHDHADHRDDPMGRWRNHWRV